MVWVPRFVMVGILVPAVLARPAAGQNWSAQQRAALDGLNACYQVLVDRNTQGELACYHRDFVGWRNGMPAPRDYAFTRGEIERTAADPNAERVIGFAIQPLSVLIQGNIAIVHYYSYVTRRNTAGVTSERRSRWTDILINDGGRWAWIADHGGIDPGTPASPTPSPDAL